MLDEVLGWHGFRSKDPAVREGFVDSEYELWYNMVCEGSSMRRCDSEVVETGCWMRIERSI